MNYITRAMLELAMLSLLAGYVGTWIMLRRRAFFAAALSHATFPGGVIAVTLGVNALVGQALAAVVLALGMSLLSRARYQGSQVASGVVLAFGFALGALLSSLQKTIRVPVDALLVGQVFSVDSVDLVVTALATVVCLVVVALYWRTLLFDTFDTTGFRAAGGNPLIPETVTAFLVAVVVVVSMPAVGAILSIAIVVGPAATAHLLVRDIRFVAPLATVLALCSSGIGLWISWHWDIAAGGAIGVLTAVLFLGAYGVNTLRNRRFSVKSLAIG